MKKILAGLMFLILSLTGCTQVEPTTQAPTQVATTQATSSAQCEEDMPCWDCKTMGNKLCGPQAKPTKAPAKPTPKAQATQVQAAQPIAQVEPPTQATQPITGAMLEQEAQQFATFEYIPMDEFTTVTYQGLSPYDLTDGDVLWSVQSQLDPSLWHTYHVILTPAPETIVYLPTTAPKPTQAAPAPTKAPTVSAPKPTVKPTPQPTQQPTAAPQPTATATPPTGPGACMGWQLKMDAWNAAHPDDQLTPADMGRICTDK